MGGTFTPRFFYIIAITLGVRTVLQFSTDHDYVLGEYVSTRVSQPYGTKELNNVRGKIISLTSDTVTIDVDSNGFTPFIYPVSGKNTPPVCVPAGSGIIPDFYPSTVTLEDAFDDLPPD